jgi:hypothetical protein
MNALDDLTLLERLEHYPETVSRFSLEILVTKENCRGRNARIAPLAFLELERREERQAAMNPKQKAGQLGGRATVARHGREHMTWRRGDLDPLHVEAGQRVSICDGPSRDEQNNFYLVSL